MSNSQDEIRDKSPFLIKEMLVDGENIDEDMKALTIKVLKPLDLCSVAGAISVLDNAKEVLLKCTRIHSEYL